MRAPRKTVLLYAALLATLAAAAVVASPASAETLSPWWHLSIDSRPGALEAGGDGEIVILASNLGDSDIEGPRAPVRIADTLPPGVRALSAQGLSGLGSSDRGPVKCPSAGELQKGAPVACTYEGVLPPYDLIELRIEVEVEAGAGPSLLDDASVSGGLAEEVSLQRALRVGGEPPFGVEEYRLTPEEPGGRIDTQAGSHPFQLTTSMSLQQTADPTPTGPAASAAPVALPKDLTFNLPPGLIGNPTPFPRCALGQFLSSLETFTGTANLCAPQTAVGVAVVSYDLLNSAGKGATGASSSIVTETVPLFNLEPGTGEPARFGFSVDGTATLLDTSVRTGGDYGVTVSVHNVTEAIAFTRSEVTFWGTPGNPSHNAQRGWGCIEAARVQNPTLPCQALEEGGSPPPLLELPDACAGKPLGSSVLADSWSDPHDVLSFEATEPLVTLDGCNELPFEPSIKVVPDGTAGSSPTGLLVDVHVPQQESLNANGLAESDPRQITVAMPPGVVVNPSSGDGLQACSESLVGFEGMEELATVPGTQSAIFTPRLPGSHAALEAGETAPFEPGLNFCAQASKIATVTIRTPLLRKPLEGAVYLASQNANPFGSLIALYLVAEDAKEPEASGVLVKLAGETALCHAAGETIAGVACAAAGQLIATFQNSPQAPFEDAELHFFGGERAPLATPARCGSYETKAYLTPWSAAPGEAPHEASSAFRVTSGPHGTPCPGASLPFSPSLTGGSTNINAGSFTPLTTTIGREDGQQDMQSVTLRFPPGLSGEIANVKTCGEPQAGEGLCGPESLIGETTVAAGVGSDPVSVKGGKVYITGPYNGTGSCTPGEAGCAPFGLSIVNPVKAGPFDLEHDTSRPGENMPACDCVVVRAKIEVDPYTAALTVTTDKSGPHAIPDMIDGVPVQIRKVNVLVNREHFTFNPTSCEPAKITGEIEGYEGASSPVSVPFQASNCATLKFTPKFSVSTSGKTSKADGASLTAKVSEPNEPHGSQANIAKVKVELPLQLPSRLTTLQKACTDSQFEANPAACPAASKIGYAVVHTPLLPVPLEGPAIFVSHGGEAFPSLTMVLQGDGVTVDLVGTTYISPKGITSTTFKAVPDAPFNTFELTLPEGPYSALAANGNLCAEKLVMPTEFIAQNGAEIHQKTNIGVKGCPPAITVLSHKVKGGVATLKVKVPAAGRLLASGKGLSKTSKQAKSASTLTIEVHLTKSEAAFLSHHHGRKLKAKIHLTFTPKAKGAKRLAASTSVLIG